MVRQSKTQRRIRTSPRGAASKVSKVSKVSAKVTAPGTPKRAANRPTVNPRVERRSGGSKSLPGAPRLAPRGEIARGGMGVVHRVFDTRMERTTALKVIDPELATHPEMVARFFDEARITGLLN